jgi:hypothetical protein
MIHGPRTIQGMVILWVSMPEEIQYTEVIKQVAGICILQQRWNFACRLPRKGAAIMPKYYVAQTESPTGLQTLKQTFKRNLISSR